MFVDTAKIIVKAGKGGNGCASFYRDRLNRYGRPDGGEGGAGGDIIIKASRNVYTLLDFRYRREFIAQNGKHGTSKRQRGKDAPALVIVVPVGTLIQEEGTGCILQDLHNDGQEIVVVKGGKGGIGNFVTRGEATTGKLGETRSLVLDLKLIADVGIVGFPNAGKSTLISRITSARPKIAPYPFTTKEPMLGVVNNGDVSFTIADIPGLIEGAHQGKGLGDKFLRHVERTKILVHLIDMAGLDARDPLDDFEMLNKELELYSEEVGHKAQIVVANKIDIASAHDNLKRFKKKFGKAILEISAKEGIGLGDLITEIIATLKRYEKKDTKK